MKCYSPKCSHEPQCCSSGPPQSARPSQTSGYRRGCRPECCKPPPRCTRSSQSHYSGPRTLQERTNKNKKFKSPSKRTASQYAQSMCSPYLLLCYSSMRCNALSQSLSHDASPQQTGRRCSPLGGQRGRSPCSSKA